MGVAPKCRQKTCKLHDRDSKDFVNQLHRELYSADFLDEPSKLTLTEWMAEIDYRLVEGGGEQIQLDALTAQIVNLLK